MVKLESLTQEEILGIEDRKKWIDGRLKDIQRQIKFIEITRNIVGKSRICVISGEIPYQPDDEPYRDACIQILIGKKFFGLTRIKFPITSYYGNHIDVDDPQYFDEALRLAQTYEEASFGEFTVKKQYIDNK